MNAEERGPTTTRARSARRSALAAVSAACAVVLLATGCNPFPSLDRFSRRNGGRDAGPDVSSSARNLECGLEPTYLKPLRPHRSALFGAAVAADSDTIAVVAPLERNTWGRAKAALDAQQVCEARRTIVDPSISGAGIVRAYQRTGNTWREQELLIDSRVGAERSVIASDLLPPAFQAAVIPGYSIAVSGNRIAVGTPGDGTGGPFRGSVRVFTRLDGTWTEESYLVENRDGADGDLFGFAVALSDDTLVVGAPGEEVQGAGNADVTMNAGAVHVFRLGDEATHIARVTPGLLDEQGFYGAAVAVSPKWVAVGAPLQDSEQAGFPGTPAGRDSGDDEGAVYTYAREGDDLRPSPALTGTQRVGNLGISLALSGDELAVGEPSIIGEQRVGLYALGSGDTPALEATLTPNDPDAYLFGYSVAMRDDAVLVGAPYTGGRSDGASSGNIFVPYYQSSGSTYLFRRNGVAGRPKRCRMKASNADPCDNFGVSIAAAEDYFVIGSPFEDGRSEGIGGDGASNDLLDTGAVYIYATP